MDEANSAELIKLREACKLAESLLQAGMPDAALQKAAVVAARDSGGDSLDHDGHDALQLQAAVVHEKLDLAGVLLCCDQLTEAVTEVEQALVVFRRMSQEQTEWMNRFVREIRPLLKIAKAVEKAIQPEDAVTLYLNFAKALEGIQQMPEAAKARKSALAAARSVTVLEHDGVLDAYELLADSFKEAGDIRLAVSLMDDAFQGSLTCKGWDDSRTLEIEAQLGVLLCEDGRHQEAADHFKTASNMKRVKAGLDQWRKFFSVAQKKNALLLIKQNDKASLDAKTALLKLANQKAAKKREKKERQRLKAMAAEPTAEPEQALVTSELVAAEQNGQLPPSDISTASAPDLADDDDHDTISFGGDDSNVPANRRDELKAEAAAAALLKEEADFVIAADLKKAEKIEKRRAKQQLIVAAQPDHSIVELEQPLVKSGDGIKRDGQLQSNSTMLPLTAPEPSTPSIELKAKEKGSNQMTAQQNKSLNRSARKKIKIDGREPPQSNITDDSLQADRQTALVFDAGLSLEFVKGGSGKKVKKHGRTEKKTEPKQEKEEAEHIDAIPEPHQPICSSEVPAVGILCWPTADDLGASRLLTLYCKPASTLSATATAWTPEPLADQQVAWQNDTGTKVVTFAPATDFEDRGRNITSARQGGWTDKRRQQRVSPALCLPPPPPEAGCSAFRSVSAIVMDDVGQMEDSALQGQSSPEEIIDDMHFGHFEDYHTDSEEEEFEPQKIREPQNRSPPVTAPTEPDDPFGRSEPVVLLEPVKLLQPPQPKPTLSEVQTAVGEPFC